MQHFFLWKNIFLKLSNWTRNRIEISSFKPTNVRLSSPLSLSVNGEFTGLVLRLSAGDLWICKPSELNQGEDSTVCSEHWKERERMRNLGKGITLVRDLDELKEEFSPSTPLETTISLTTTKKKRSSRLTSMKRVIQRYLSLSLCVFICLCLQIHSQSVVDRWEEVRYSLLHVNRQCQSVVSFLSLRLFTSFNLPFRSTRFKSAHSSHQSGISLLSPLQQNRMTTTSKSRGIYIFSA